MHPPSSIGTTTSPQQPTLVDEIATAAYSADGAALGALRQRVGFDTLDDKGRLAFLQALRRKVKAEGAENGARANALRALEAAFPAPYKSLKAHAQQKAQAKALTALSGAAKVPELPASVAAEAKTAEEISTDTSAATLPEQWIRLRAQNGVIDIPRDTFHKGSYFDTLINGNMQGGRDASGAYMVNADIEALRAIVHFESHNDLPPLSAEQRATLCSQAGTFCLTDLVASLNAPPPEETPRALFDVAQQRALKNLQGKVAKESDEELLMQFSVRAFRVMSLRLQAFVIAPDENPQREVSANIGDMMFGRLKDDVTHVFYQGWINNHRPTYGGRDEPFLSGQYADRALHRAALACEAMLNDLGYLVKSCCATQYNNSITFSMLK